MFFMAEWKGKERRKEYGGWGWEGEVEGEGIFI